MSKILRVVTGMLGVLGFALVVGACSSESHSSPPSAFLVTEEIRIEAGIGSYCWLDGENVGVCADMVGRPISQREVTLTSGEAAHFLFTAAPEEPLMLQVYDLSTAEIEEDDFARWCVESGELVIEDELPVVATPEFTATFSPGQYLAIVSGRWSQGDASYGFAFDVTAD